MNVTGFSICIIVQLSDGMFRFMYFSSQSHALSFSECLNAMTGSKGREDKNKEIKITVEGDLCKLLNLSRRQDQVSVEFCIIHFKSGLLNRRTESIVS